MNKLFVTEDYYLLVFETEKDALNAVGQAKIAITPPLVASGGKFDAEEYVRWWAERLKCHVWYSEPGDVFLALEETINKITGNPLKVLHGSRVGWIFARNWLDLKEIPHE